MTVRHLIADLTAAKVRLEVDRLGVSWTAVGDDPPAHLLAALLVLHTGIRAVLTGKRWYGLDPKTGKACGPFPARGDGLLAFGALDPAAKLPHNVSMLSVGGDTCWDRLDPSARLELSYLFATEPERGRP